MRVLVALGIFAVGMVLLVVGFVVTVRVVSNDEPLDCSTVELPDAERWERTELPERLSAVGDLSACERFDGLTSAELTAALGPPDGQDATADGRTVLVWVMDPEDDPGDSDEVRLFLRDDRVVESDVVYSSA